ncbi:MAG: hypothetical protein JWM10_3015 [Myxococcaceae bacterium]|nr:hypothetical protein [Myxococcaceae bacterium]
MTAPLVSVGGRATQEACARIAARARQIAASLGEKYTLNLRMPTDAAQRLRWFDGGTTQGQPARPILVLDGRAREAATEAITQRLRSDLASGRPLNMLVALTIGAQAIRTIYVDRLATNGGDVRVAPLSPKYLFTKVRRGLDPRTGVATGATLQALTGAQLVVSRVG